MTIFHLLCFFVGLQLFVYGLNGFKSFLPRPQQTIKMQKTIDIFLGIPQFMNFIKIYEIVCGLMLILQIKTQLVMIILMPLIFMIFYLQWTLNRPFSRTITIQLFFPYLMMLIIKYDHLINILHEVANA